MWQGFYIQTVTRTILIRSVSKDTGRRLIKWWRPKKKKKNEDIPKLEINFGFPLVFVCVFYQCIILHDIKPSVSFSGSTIYFQTNNPAGKLLHKCPRKRFHRAASVSRWRLVKALQPLRCWWLLRARCWVWAWPSFFQSNLAKPREVCKTYTEGPPKRKFL